MGWLGGATSLVLGGCGPFGGVAAYRFRMTVEVETPQGLKAGSSVYEVVAERNSTRLLTEERAGGVTTRGQATVVDLHGSPLFVLMKMPRAGDGLGAIATYALSPETPRGGIDNFLRTVEGLGGWFGGAKADLPRDDWPIMVQFRDINVPSSVEEIRPEDFGVKRILLETTSDDVTSGIEKTLTWLGDRGMVVSGPKTNPKLTRTIRHESFWQGIRS